MHQQLQCYYHYTSVAAALGIISTRAVWLTDYRFLNDRRELHQGLESFLSQIPKDQQDSFHRAFAWHDLSNHHCVFSLSQSPEILSQWRAYASDGAGIALGLNKTYLEQAGLTLIECCYEDHDKYASDLIQRHSAFLRSVHDASITNHAENDFMNWVAAQKSHFYRLIEDLIALKNPAFSEEREVRAVWCRPMSEVKLRSARDLVIPYVEANICPDTEMFENEKMRKQYLNMVIPLIWLGPKCNELNRLSFYSLTEGMSIIHRHDCGYV